MTKASIVMDLLDRCEYELATLLLVTAPQNTDRTQEEKKILKDVICRKDFDWNKFFIMSLWHKVDFIALEYFFEHGLISEIIKRSLVNCCL